MIIPVLCGDVRERCAGTLDQCTVTLGSISRCRWNSDNDQRQGRCHIFYSCQFIDVLVSITIVSTFGTIPSLYHLYIMYCYLFPFCANYEINSKMIVELWSDMRLCIIVFCQSGMLFTSYCCALLFLRHNFKIAISSVWAFKLNILPMPKDKKWLILKGFNV